MTPNKTVPIDENSKMLKEKAETQKQRRECGL